MEGGSAREHSCYLRADPGAGSACIYCFKFFVRAADGPIYIGANARGRMGGRWLRNCRCWPPVTRAESEYKSEYKLDASLSGTGNTSVYGGL